MPSAEPAQGHVASQLFTFGLSLPSTLESFLFSFLDKLSIEYYSALKRKEFLTMPPHG
jgi:hypothetical protein